MKYNLQVTYAMKGFDLTSQRSIGNEDGRSNLDGAGKLWVRASDSGVISMEGVVSDDLKILSSD